MEAWRASLSERVSEHETAPILPPLLDLLRSTPWPMLLTALMNTDVHGSEDSMALSRGGRSNGTGVNDYIISVIINLSLITCIKYLKHP